MPDPAPRPFTRKLQVIHITEPCKVGQNRADYRVIEFLITKLFLDLGPAPGPIGQKPVRRIFSAGKFLVVIIRCMVRDQVLFFSFRIPHSTIRIGSLVSEPVDLEIAVP